MKSKTTIQKNIKQHPWPSMRANQQNSGRSMHSLELKKDAPIISYPTGNAIFSTPIIDHNETIFVGSADQKFYAFNPLKNSLIWSFKTNGVIDSAACLDEKGSIYVPSGDASLYKLSSIGQKIWEFNVLEKNYARASTIYWWEANAAIGPNGFMYAGNDNFSFYAIRPDGSVAWSFPTGLQVWSVGAFGRGLVYVTSFDMCVYALRQDSGQVVWKQRLKNVIASSPALDNDGNICVASFDGQVVSLDGQTGRVRWRFKTQKSVYASAAIGPDNVVFIGSGDGHVYAIESKTGVLLWKLSVGSPVWSSMAIGQDPEKKEAYLAYVGTSAGLVIALTPPGQRRWTYQVASMSPARKAGINASLALGRGGLAVASTSGTIIYLPYDAYQRYSETFSPSDDLAQDKGPVTTFPTPQPTTPASLPAANDMVKEGQSLVINKMEFTKPEIINPFDQIGIASLNIQVGIIRQDSDSGRLVAFGVQAVAMKDGNVGHQGIPYPRRHIYAFNGIRNKNTYLLQAKNCEFDITAFPIPLDRLWFEFSFGQALAESHPFGAMLDCRGLWHKIIRKYGQGILWYILSNTYKNITTFKFQMVSVARMSSAFWHMLIGKIWRSWDLINEHGHLDARGTFFISDVKPVLLDIRFQKAWFDRKKRRVVATFIANDPHCHHDWPGVFLLQKHPLRALALDYGRHFHIKRRDHIITATLTIPEGIDLTSGLEAVILINTTAQASLNL